MSKKHDAAGFLTTTFGRTFPEGKLAALWSGKTKKSAYIAAPNESAEFAGEPDVYVAACLTAKRVGVNRRPTANDAAGIPGVWADIDVTGGPDQPPTKRPAPSEEAATELAHSILEPTIVVNSGYGLQAWWLFEDVRLLGSKDEREQAQKIALGWQVLLRREANNRGFTIDSTHDLARLMRLPGTFNDKGPPKQRADVRMLDHDGPRHAFEAIADIATEHAPRISAGAGTVKVELTHPFPMTKFEALRDNDENFRKTWEHTRRDRDCEGWSTSEYDMALAAMAARRNWTDDELAALIIAHRKKHNGEGDPKAGRADYIGRTIGRARADERREERERVREEALHELAARGEDESGAPHEPKEIMQLFNAVISAGDPRAPRFKELVQYSTDPDSARFVLVMEDGTEVNVGAYDNLRQPRRLDRRIGPVTGWVMETVKDDDVWRDAIRTLMGVRAIREEEDEPVFEWVRRYTEDRLTGKAQEAAKNGEPFEEDGQVYVKTAPLARFVRKVLAENLSGHSDLIPLLRRAGFEQKSVHFTSRTGTRSTASYWRIPKGEL